MIRALALFSLATAALVGCQAWRTSACKTVDTLENACTLLRYTTPDGTTHEVPVGRREVMILGERVRAARLNDAGVQ